MRYPADCLTGAHRKLDKLPDAMANAKLGLVELKISREQMERRGSRIKQTIEFHPDRLEQCYPRQPVHRLVSRPAHIPVNSHP
jgi:hypothetical protein